MKKQVFSDKRSATTVMASVSVSLRSVSSYHIPHSSIDMMEVIILLIFWTLEIHVSFSNFRYWNTGKNMIT